MFSSICVKNKTSTNIKIIYVFRANPIKCSPPTAWRLGSNSITNHTYISGKETFFIHSKNYFVVELYYVIWVQCLIALFSSYACLYQYFKFEYAQHQSFLAHQHSSKINFQIINVPSTISELIMLADNSYYAHFNSFYLMPDFIDQCH